MVESNVAAAAANSNANSDSNAHSTSSGVITQMLRTLRLLPKSKSKQMMTSAPSSTTPFQPTTTNNNTIISNNTSNSSSSNSSSNNSINMRGNNIQSVNTNFDRSGSFNNKISKKTNGFEGSSSVFYDPMYFGFVMGCICHVWYPYVTCGIVLYSILAFVVQEIVCYAASGMGAVVGVAVGGCRKEVAVEEEEREREWMLSSNRESMQKKRVGQKLSSSTLSSNAAAAAAAVPEVTFTNHTDEMIVTEESASLNISSTATVATRVTNDPIEKVIISDLMNMEVAPKNKIHNVRSKSFEGQCLFMIRPADDHPDRNAVEFFEGKQRRFEFQFQGKLKMLPKGQMYMAMELSWAPKYGMIQRTIVTTALQFMKKFNKGFSYKIDNAKPRDDGKYEKPHLAFPVETCMDRFIVTKPNETPPSLGQQIFEDPADIKTRKKGKVKIDWNLDDTYTMVVYSSYVDWIDWEILGLPGIRPFGIASATGNQPISLKFYSLPSQIGAASSEHIHHYLCDQLLFSEHEITHTETVEGGFGKEILRTANLASAQKSELTIDVVEDTDIAPLLSPRTVEEIDAADDLAVGVYLHSNDHIVLSDNVNSPRSAEFISNGGGFAVMQSMSTSKFALEKVVHGRSSRLSTSKAIHCGDVVLVKLINEDKTPSSPEVRYLSTHRGWWLKWVKDKPRHNGHFVVSSVSSEDYSSENSNRAIELGSPFSLRHKRWSGFEVGVATKSSTSFGGRLLGLKKVSNVEATSFPTAEDNDDDDDDDDEGPNSLTDQDKKIGQGKEQWLESISFVANYFTGDKENPIIQNVDISEQANPCVNSEQVSCGIMVSAWVEVFDRSTRKTQRTYAVKLIDEDECGQSVSLKTGKELVPMLQLGRSLAKISSHMLYDEEEIDDDESDEYDSPSESVEEIEEENIILEANDELLNNVIEGSELVVREDHRGEPLVEVSPSLRPRLQTADDANVNQESQLAGQRRRTWSSDNILLHDKKDPNNSDEVFQTNQAESSSPSSPRSKRRANWLMKPARGVGKVGKTAIVQSFNVTKKIGQGSFAATKFIGKGSYVVTKKIGKGSYVVTKKVGQGTVAAIAGVTRTDRRASKAKEPKRKEPRGVKKEKGTRQTRRIERRKGKDHHLVINKFIKTHRSIKTKIEGGPIAGLLAPDQSIHDVNNVLTYVTSSSVTSYEWKNIMNTLSSTGNHLNSWFLQGDAAELGVTPKDNVIFGAVVARGLWESHWVEEWATFDNDCMYFYTPLSKKPDLVIAIEHIVAVRDVSPSSLLDPFPRLGGILAIETIWRTIYIVFQSGEMRETFKTKLLVLIASIKSICDKENRILDATGTFAPTNPLDHLKQSQWSTIADKNGRSKSRILLNSRLQSFDIEPLEGTDVQDKESLQGEVSKLVGDTLRGALSLTDSSLEESPNQLISFLNSTCKFSYIPLHKLDFGSESTLCILINLYHCLTQHALLVQGSPDRTSVSLHLRRCCYEIDGNAFSLADIEFMIRCNSSSPTHTKNTQFVLPPKGTLNRLRQEYGLAISDTRINFVLNCGMLPNPREVMILSSESIDNQLKQACVNFLRHNLTIDYKSNRIFLPKVTEIFKNDFDGSTSSIISYCLPFIDEKDKKLALCNYLKGDNSTKQLEVRFQPITWEYYTSLEAAN